MNISDEDSDMSALEARLVRLCRGVPIDPVRKAHLRDELVRRHQELSAETTQRAAGMLWPRIRGLKRLTLVAPPALAAAVACFALVWALQVSGHRDTQAALAARISRALAQTVPTVTAWQVTVEESRGSTESSYTCLPIRLGRRRLYVRDSRLYLYANRWFQVTPASVGTGCPATWQWAFRGMTLQRDKPVITPDGRIAGHATDLLVYSPRRAGRLTYQARAWVDRRTGLVLRLQTSEARGTRVVAVSQASYSYGIQSRP